MVTADRPATHTTVTIELLVALDLEISELFMVHLGETVKTLHYKLPPSLALSPGLGIEPRALQIHDNMQLFCRSSLEFLALSLPPVVLHGLL